MDSSSAKPPARESDQMGDNPESSSNNDDPSQVPNRSAFSWAEASEAERAKRIEKAFWNWHADAYPMRAPKEPTDFKKPSRRWWLESPATLPAQAPGYLCEVCRHVNFEYLIESPIEQILEEFELVSLQWVIEHEECAFCRLIASTVRSAIGGRTPSTQVDGKDVMCRFRTLPMEMDTSGPRQLCLVLSPPPEGVDGSSNLRFYKFRAPDDLLPGGKQYGQPFLSPRIDHELVKKWYLNCQSGNCRSNPMPVPRKILPKGFRLIDVKRYCIVDYETDFEYVALSYVWGAAETLLNVKRIRESLEEDRALIDRMEELPKTIKDAISLTDSIGQTHLWVDSLCIVQDDVDDARLQIQAMDQIYSAAALTIAVASGENANIGIAGMTAGPRSFKQHIAKMQGIYMANCPAGFVTAVDDSVWNTRAWTFQERLLSPRVLFVTEQRCFFMCQHRQDAFIESDDTVENGLGRKPDPSVYKDQTMNMMSSSQSINVVSYSRVVEAYTSRCLTHPSDILRAFEGIASRFRPLFRSDFLFGLPRSELDSQILWQPGGPITRRRDPKTGIPIFPSWSWAGWVGKIKCDTHENLSRIEWVEDGGELFSGKDFRYPTGANKDVIARLQYRMQWRGALENGVPYYWEKEHPQQWFFHPTAPEEGRVLGPNLRNGTEHLVFEAETLDVAEIGFGHYWPMRIWRDQCTNENHLLCPLAFRDADNYVVGYIMVPGEISTNASKESKYGLVRISRGKIFGQKDRGEGNPDLLIDEEAITMEKTSFPDRPDIQTANDDCCFDQRRFDGRKKWCVYNVMLVEWKDEVAYRLGVGKMHIDAWAQAKPTKRTVVLG